MIHDSEFRIPISEFRILNFYGMTEKCLFGDRNTAVVVCVIFLEFRDFRILNCSYEWNRKGPGCFVHTSTCTCRWGFVIKGSLTPSLSCYVPSPAES